MEFAEGRRITDMEYVDACGLRRADVARLLSEAFCTQARQSPARPAARARGLQQRVCIGQAR